MSLNKAIEFKGGRIKKTVSIYYSIYDKVWNSIIFYNYVWITKVKLFLFCVT